MNRIEKLFLSLTCMLLLCSGCNKMLDLQPKDYIDEKEIYSSISRFEGAVLGCYTDLKAENAILIGAVMSDEAKIDPQNIGVDGFAGNLYRWVATSDDEIIFDIWKNYYQQIYRVNVLLNHIDMVPDDGQPEKIAHLHAELLLLRAYLHFELQRVFGLYEEAEEHYGIPYVVDTNLSNKPKKMSTANFYTYLWKDIQQAESLGFAEYRDSRFNAVSAQALAARIALYAGHNERAIAYSTAIISKSSWTAAADYPKIFKDQSSAEVLLRLKRNQADAFRPNNLFEDYSSGKKLFSISNKLKSTLQAESGLRSEFLEQHESAGGPGIWKYPGNSYSDRINDVKVFRLAEIYLIRAEAYLKLGQQDAALADLNLLRRQRQVEEIQKPSLDQWDILQERFVELAFEGHRYFDLKRYKLNIERIKSDLALPTDPLTLSITDAAYHIDIPLHELQVNPDIK